MSGMPEKWGNPVEKETRIGGVGSIPKREESNFEKLAEIGGGGPF